MSSGMREAPDVPMIGEVRDREDAQARAIFAQTGICAYHAARQQHYHRVNRIVNFFPTTTRAQSALS